MVSVLVGWRIKYRFGIPVVAMVSGIWVLSGNPLIYIRPLDAGGYPLDLLTGLSRVVPPRTILLV